jgi:hypothetical protein
LPTARSIERQPAFAGRSIFNKIFAIERQVSQIYFADFFQARAKQNNKF